MQHAGWNKMQNFPDFFPEDPFFKTSDHHDPFHNRPYLKISWRENSCINTFSNFLGTFSLSLLYRLVYQSFLIIFDKSQLFITVAENILLLNKWDQINAFSWTSQTIHSFFHFSSSPYQYMMRKTDKISVFRQWNQPALVFFFSVMQTECSF